MSRISRKWARVLHREYSHRSSLRTFSLTTTKVFVDTRAHGPFRGSEAHRRRAGDPAHSLGTRTEHRPSSSRAARARSAGRVHDRAQAAAYHYGESAPRVRRER